MQQIMQMGSPHISIVLATIVVGVCVASPRSTSAGSTVDVGFRESFDDERLLDRGWYDVPYAGCGELY